MRAYVFIETKSGMVKKVAKHLHGLSITCPHLPARLLTIDTVTGPYDVIAVVEATNMDGIRIVLAEEIQEAEGIERTVSCFAAPAS